MAVKMLFKLHDKPPLATTILVSLQHVLAVFGGIVTAPLITALGMGLNLEETSYLVSSSLVISGIATLVQIQRLGPLGSGLLSIQGTSFSFIGPLIFAYTTLIEGKTPEQALGVILGSCAVCSLVMIGLSRFIDKLQTIVTTNVSGTTVILIGFSLIWTTLNNLYREYDQVVQQQGTAWLIAVLTVSVFLLTFLLSVSRKPLVRLSSITVGLVVGSVIAWALGFVDFSQLQALEIYFYPTVNHFPLSFDLRIFIILMPIFIISATETVGDLTATSTLSGLALDGKDYWTRIKGGISGDAFNSFLAAVFGSFPNTTFSQNNGVIRLTGVCSTYIGIFVAIFICLLGLFPIVGGLFIIIPGAVLYGATMLMFIMVLISGFNIVKAGDSAVKNWPLVAMAVIIGVSASFIIPKLVFLPAALSTLLQFPISTGAMCAILFELLRTKIFNQQVNLAS